MPPPGLSKTQFTAAAPAAPTPSLAPKATAETAKEINAKTSVIKMPGGPGKPPSGKVNAGLPSAPGAGVKAAPQVAGTKPAAPTAPTSPAKTAVTPKPLPVPSQSGGGGEVLAIAAAVAALLSTTVLVLGFLGIL